MQLSKIVVENLYNHITTIVFQVSNIFKKDDSNTSPLQFNIITINTGNGFDNYTSSFQAVRSGFYWFFFVVTGSLPGNVNYTMYDILTTIRTSVIDDRKRSARLAAQSDLRHLSSLNTLKMFLQWDYLLETEEWNYLILTWIGFNIDNISTVPPTAFNVMRKNGVWNASSLANAFLFDIVLVNSRKCWNDAQSTFTAPVEGVYIFSFSATITSGSINSLIILHKMQRHVTEPKQNSTVSIIPLCSAYLSESNVDVISVSGSAMVMMAVNDFVFIFSNTLNNYIQVSFKGFLYSPANNLFIAWSTRFDWNISREIQFDVNNRVEIVFSDIVLNIGNVIRNNDKSKMILPIDGIYYITCKTSEMLPAVSIIMLVNRKKSNQVLISGNTAKSNLSHEQSFVSKHAANDILSFQIGLQKKFSATVYNALCVTGFLIAPI